MIKFRIFKELFSEFYKKSYIKKPLYDLFFNTLYNIKNTSSAPYTLQKTTDTYIKHPMFYKPIHSFNGHIFNQKNISKMFSKWKMHVMNIIKKLFKSSQSTKVQHS